MRSPSACSSILVSGIYRKFDISFIKYQKKVSHLTRMEPNARTTPVAVQLPSYSTTFPNSLAIPPLRLRRGVTRRRYLNFYIWILFLCVHSFRYCSLAFDDIKGYWNFKKRVRNKSYMDNEVFIIRKPQVMCRWCWSRMNDWSHRCYTCYWKLYMMVCFPAQSYWVCKVIYWREIRS